MSFDPDTLVQEIQFDRHVDVVPPLSEIREYGGDWGLCGPVLFLYRAHAEAYDPYGEGDSGYLRVRFHFSRYRVVRFTPCGAWVTDAPYWYDAPKLRWVSLDRFEGKRLGYTCREKAMRSLQRRNSRQVQILQHNLACAEQVYAVLNPEK